MVEKIKQIATSGYQNPVILCCDENRKEYISYAKTLAMGPRKHLEEISKHIFKNLRKVDRENPDIVLIEGVEKNGLGLAIMNRLLRACEYQYIEV